MTGIQSVSILLSTLHVGQESAYEAAHAAIPDDLMALLNGAGVRDWVIWRDGLSLLHLIDVDDYDAMGAAIATHPVNERWQAEMAQYVERFDVITTIPALTAPTLVWSMAAQLSAANTEGEVR